MAELALAEISAAVEQRLSLTKVSARLGAIQAHDMRSVPLLYLCHCAQARLASAK